MLVHRVRQRHIAWAIEDGVDRTVVGEESQVRPVLIPVFVVGKRTQENVNLLIAILASVTDGTIPFFTSDDLPHYKGALFQTYGVLEMVERRPGQRGRPRKPRLLPLPELKYAIVVKKRERGHVVSVETGIIFGDEATILALLAASPVSNTINTSYVERQNLTIRQGSRRLTRKVNAFSKERDWLEKQLWLAFTYYHFVLPHLGLRKRLPEPIPTKAEAHPEVSIEVVVDRYHVAKNYRECVDKVRKQECRRLKKELSKTEYEEIKGVMWIVRENNEDLSSDERKKLNRLFEYSSELKLAYTFREELTAIFEMRLTKEEAKKRLLKWADKVRRSVLTCFDQFLTTLDNWLDEIVNYFVNRLSSGFVEGLNNKVKTIKRRCYGILRVTTLFQRLYLDLEGYRRFA